MARYNKLDRVRVNTGRERGHYGTIREVSSKNGYSDCPYYYVSLDCNPDVLGYAENELDPAIALDWHAITQPIEPMEYDVESALLALGAEERLAILRKFCQSCGVRQGDRPCQCWNDA